MPSAQPRSTDRAPARERELGVSGGNETDVAVRQQSTTAVVHDKPVRAQRRRLPRHDRRSARKLELDDAEATRVGPAAEGGLTANCHQAGAGVRGDHHAAGALVTMNLGEQRRAIGQRPFREAGRAWRRRDQAPPINDRACAGPTTRS